jgi:hypothetical protein
MTPRNGLFRQPERKKVMTTQPAFDPINDKQTVIVAIVTFQLPRATTAEEMSAPFEAAVPMFQSVAGLLTKYFYVSEDGRRAGGIYVWASRAEADRLYNGEWRAFVEKKFGSPPTIDFLNSPVMVDNRDRKSA